MKVAMYYNNSDVRVEEMPRPLIGEKELLVKVFASGVCGSDVLEWYRVKKAPIVLGHEMSGVVEEAGSEVSEYKVGDRIFVTHHVPCLECHYCQAGHETACETLHTTNFHPGGFSQFIRIPEINVRIGTLKIPDSLSFEEATFIEPLACVIRGQRIARIRKGQDVLVLGCGLSGLLHIKLALAKGARVIGTNRGEFRREFAKKLGADVIDGNDDVPAKVKELLGKKADVIIDCAGSPETASQALQAADRGGTVLFFAVPPPDRNLDIPINEFWRNEMKLMTSYAASPADLKEALELLNSGIVKVNDLISHQLPLERAQKAFRLTSQAKDSLKVILKPNEQRVSMIESSQLTKEERVPFTAELRVEDFETSLDFYTKKLGFNLFRIDRSNQVAVLEFNKGFLLVKEEKGLPSRGKGFFIRFIAKDIDGYYKELQDRGAKTLGSPELRSWGAKRFYAEDPDGFKIQFIPEE